MQPDYRGAQPIAGETKKAFRRDCPRLRHAFLAVSNVYAKNCYLHEFFRVRPWTCIISHARYLHFFLVRCDIRLHIMYIVPIHSVTARSKSDVNLTLLGAGSTPLQTTACHPHIIHIGLYCRNIRQPSRMTPIQRSVDPFHARRVHIRAPRDTPKYQAVQRKGRNSTRSIPSGVYPRQTATGPSDELLHCPLLDWGGPTYICACVLILLVPQYARSILVDG